MKLSDFNTIEKIESQSNYISMMDTIISIFYKLTLSNIDIKLLDKDDLYYSLCKKSVNSISSEDLQLYYQIAISSKKDFRQAPSKKDHFTMIILRMIYFANDSGSKIIDNKKKYYSWKGVGSEYRSAELPSALLFSQLVKNQEIQSQRSKLWNFYFKSFRKIDKISARIFTFEHGF